MVTITMTPWNCPPWKANSCSTSQEIPCFLRNLKVCDYLQDVITSNPSSLLQMMWPGPQSQLIKLLW